MRNGRSAPLCATRIESRESRAEAEAEAGAEAGAGAGAAEGGTRAPPTRPPAPVPEQHEHTTARAACKLRTQREPIFTPRPPSVASHANTAARAGQTSSVRAHAPLAAPCQSSNQTRLRRQSKFIKPFGASSQSGARDTSQPLTAPLPVGPVWRVIGVIIRLASCAVDSRRDWLARARQRGNEGGRVAPRCCVLLRSRAGLAIICQRASLQRPFVAQRRAAPFFAERAASGADAASAAHWAPRM